jgi:mRNA interferase MazF
MSNENGFPHRGDVYWVDLDPTKGSEINKRRPCVVISVTPINKARRTVVVIPLSTSPQPRPPIVIKLNSLKGNSVAVCDQIRTIDKSRLVNLICKISEEDMENIQEALKGILGL